jgi:hypothetical protein
MGTIVVTSRQGEKVGAGGAAGRVLGKSRLKPAEKYLAISKIAGRLRPVSWI